MDITQPGPAQHQLDDPSGGEDAESSAPNEVTDQAAEASGQAPEVSEQGPEGSELGPVESAPVGEQADRPQRFADVLAEVDEVGGRPLAEHNDVFTRAHRELTDALNDVERGDS